MSSGALSEGQVGAFAMAVWFRGMDKAETVALTLAMARSGDTLTWSGIGRPVADKHSTGGVGDNVSLMLAPIAAACGLAVPMISGRGLGHTGGTLDKLESIPGYVITPDAARFRKVVDEVGCAIIGQTGSLAPADRRLYAVRDVTATVDSVPLITASILSKKLAAGLETLVLDVKVGNGAFMTSRKEAETLARSLVDVANGAGVSTSALITDMNEPLADAAGNVVELRNCLDFLGGRKTGTRLETVVLAFAAEMLVRSGIAGSLADGEATARRAVTSGEAAERFARMVHGLGGPADLLDQPDKHLSSAPVQLPVRAARDGVGSLAVTRARSALASSISVAAAAAPTIASTIASASAAFLPLGTLVQQGDAIAIVHASDGPSAEKAASEFSAHYIIADEMPDPPAVIVARFEELASRRGAAPRPRRHRSGVS